MLITFIENYSAQNNAPAPPLAEQEAASPAQNISYDELICAHQPFGKGDTAEVFLVRYKGTQRAFKKFKESFESPSSQYTKEKYYHLQLQHPHIIQLICFVDACFGPCGLVLELAERTLQSYLDNFTYANRDPALCKQYACGIVKGVQYLHSKNIAHRDLNPSNILIINNIAKLSDFGLCVSNNQLGNKAGIGWHRSLEEIIRCDLRALLIILYLLTTEAQASPSPFSIAAFLNNTPAEIVPATASVQLQCVIHWGLLHTTPERRPSIEKIVEVVNDPETIFRQIKNK